jgi:diguanylate cyclase (GGDEF)-like protein
MMRFARSGLVLRLAHHALPFLLAVLLAFGAHTVWYIVANEKSLREAQRSVDVNRAYNDGAQAVLRAHLALERYRLDADPAVEADFRASIDDTLAAMRFISQHGSEADRQLIGRLVTEHADDLTRAGNFITTALVTEADPSSSVLTDVMAELEREASRSAAVTDAQLSFLQANLNQQIVIAILVFALGIPMTILLVLRRRLYELAEASTQAQIRRLDVEAHTDSLTGLGNHRAFQEQLQAQVERAKRLGTELSLAVIDFDDFKTINDRDGHARGDQVLIEFGQMLRGATGDRGKAYRIGGDEFALIVPGLPPEETETLMETVRGITLDSLERLTVSIGIAALDDQMQDLESLRDGADLALYEAKRRGRNMVSYFAGPVTQKTVVTTTKLSALHRILDEGPVSMAFQPVWNVNWTHVIGYEALARFPGEGQLTGPQEAFDLAERMGKAYELDQRCIHAVLREVDRLPPDAQLFMNISPRSFENASFSPRVLAGQMTEAGLPTSRVCIEITERSRAPIDVIERACSELRHFGFRIALDDVGSGNSGLEILNHLPVDYVKIDPAVTRNAVSNSRSRAVMLAIVAFAVESGAQVIAEGVETVEMLSLIRKTNGPGAGLRIDGMQGRLLGRPDDLEIASIGDELRRRAS